MEDLMVKGKKARLTYTNPWLNIYLSKCFLKAETVRHAIKSVSSLFQISITLWEKKYFLVSNLKLCLYSLSEWPLRLVEEAILKKC